MRQSKWIRVFLLSLALLMGRPYLAQAVDNGLALTPPMGWNSWNVFACNINEKLVRSMADAIVSSGMKDAGYKYVVIDDCWQISRDEKGNIVADPAKFPSGIKALADYIHSKGLKFGIYSDAGIKTCGGRPGSLGHEAQDAKQYAAWGVDYLKYDWCDTKGQDAIKSYTLMSESLMATGRPIVFSLCEWGTAKPWTWAQNVGNLWRTTGDICDSWEVKKNAWSTGFVKLLDMNVGLESYAGPGHWNDPDMLEVGNGGMTDEEYRSHFSLWCILAAPLIAGNNVETMKPEIKKILTNKEVIAVDQDRMGKQGKRVRKDGNNEIWVKPLSDGSNAVILFNRGSSETEISVAWADLGLPAKCSTIVRDLWAKKDIGKFADKFSAKVASHGVVMVKIKVVP